LSDLAWPVVGRRSSDATPRGGRIRFEVTGIREPLAALCAGTASTPFMVMLAVFQAVLRGYTGHDDLLIGTPTAQRTRADLEGVIGCFVNTLVMRGDLSGDPTFHELLARTRQVVQSCQLHEEMPLDLLVDALQVRRSEGRSPLFQVLLAFNDGLELTPALGGLTVSRVPMGLEAPKFEMSLHMRTQPAGLQASLQYDAGLFDAGFARAVAADFVSLLETVVRDPGRRLSELRVEGAARWRQPLPPAHSAMRQDAGVAEDVERRLAPLWRVTLGAGTIPVDVNFFDLGGTSLKAVRLFAGVEEQFGVRLPLSSLFRHGSLRAQARLLAAQLDAEAPSSTVVAIRPAGRRPPLFIVNGGAGELVSFATLASCLPGDQPVFGLQPDYEHDYSRDRLEDIAARYVAALRQHTPQGPYSLAGYCTGAALAFEIAQQLTRAGQRVAAVIVIDGLAPRLVQALTPRTFRRMLENAANWWKDDEFGKADWGGRRRWLSHRIRVRLARWQRARAQGDAALPQFPSWIVSPGARRFAQQYVRAFAAYSPSRYPGRVDVIRARTMGLFYRGPDDLGWGALAADVSTTQLIGTHNTILKEPLVQDLAAALSSALDSADGAAAVSGPGAQAPSTTVPPERRPVPRHDRHPGWAPASASSGAAADRRSRPAAPGPDPAGS
jgi:thioesterase domain-containing protein